MRATLICYVAPDWESFVMLQQHCGRTISALFTAFELATTALTVAAVALIEASSQLNADDWESATGCLTDVFWSDGMNCLIAALCFTGAMNLCTLFFLGCGCSSESEPGYRRIG
jgi:hypothetical protein